MPIELTAVECAACLKLHPTTGNYLIITACVQEHKDSTNEAYDYKRREAQEVQVKDAVVCNNNCLSELLTLKGF